MATIALTEKKILALKPKPGERIVLFDSVLKSEALGGGLCLRAGQSSKTFYATHYQNGKPAYFKLGRFPSLKLKEARAKARTFLENPQVQIDNAKAGSFKDVAEDYLKRYVRPKGLRSEHEIVRLLKTLVYTKWESKKFRSLSRSDVTKLLDGIEDQNGARQADNVLSIIRKMMNWYETRHDDYRSPIIKGMNRGTAKERARHRILNDDEIRTFWAAAEEAGTFGALVKFALLTGQRRAKIVNLRWVDVEDGVWMIETEDREKGNPGVLALPQVAVDIVKAQPRIEGNDFVFCAAKGNGPFNSFSQRKRELDKAMGEGIEPWVIHDLRRTCRSLMARAGVLPHVAERVLGHAQPGVEGVYDRHEYFDEKGDALNRVAGLIGTILNPTADNVVA